VVEAVQLHHQPESATKHPHLTALVHLADFLSYELEYGAPGAYPPAECSPAALKLLGMTLPDLQTHGEAVHQEMQQSLEILKLIE
jgi:hypothetical protein